LALVLVLGKTSQLEVSTRYFIPLIILWYTLAIVYTILLRWMPAASWHGPVQLVCDLLMVTCVIYLTGTQDSYFIWLYPLAIIVASILFSRNATFIVAGLSFILVGTLAELIYYNVIPRMQIAVPAAGNCRHGFSAICFILWLLRTCRVCCRKVCAGRARNWKSNVAKLQDLQAFNEDIIHSMRGRIANDGSQWPHSSSQPDRRRNYGLPVSGRAWELAANLMACFLASRKCRRRWEATAAA